MKLLKEARHLVEEFEQLCSSSASRDVYFINGEEINTDDAAACTPSDSSTLSYTTPLCSEAELEELQGDLILDPDDIPTEGSRGSMSGGVE